MRKYKCLEPNTHGNDKIKTASRKKSIPESVCESRTINESISPVNESTTETIRQTIW